MKGNCELVKCQICKKEMSFGRIKRHINTQHKSISIKSYITRYWNTWPLHKPCEVCNQNIVYKYKTCSPGCRNILQSQNTKGKSKPKGFMSERHKQKISKSMTGKQSGFKGGTHSKKVIEKMSNRMIGKKYHKGHKQSDYQKSQVSKAMKKYYQEGNEPWTKNNPHTSKTIKKIFKKRPMNKLETLVSSILDENNIKYYFQFFLKSKEGMSKSYDFKIKNKKILIEIDGDYFHGGPGVKKHFFKLNEVIKNDKLKNQLAKQRGYTLLRFWESDIYNRPEIIVEGIKN